MHANYKSTTSHSDTNEYSIGSNLREEETYNRRKIENKQK